MSESTLTLSPDLQNRPICNPEATIGLAISADRLNIVLQEQKQRAPLLNRDRDVIAVCDFNGFLMHLNSAGRLLFGVGLQENLSLFQVRCFSPLTQDLWDEIFATLMATGTWTGKDVLQYGQQSPIPVQLLVMAHRLENGDIDCFSIAARREQDDSLQSQQHETIEREAQLRALVENINDAIYITDPQGLFIYMSPQIQHVLGYSVAECLGRSPIEFIYPEDQPAIIQRIGELLQTGKRSISECRIMHRDGHPVWIAVSDNILRNDEGAIIGIQGSLRDISERITVEESLRQKTHQLKQAITDLQQAQARMVQSEKMSALGQLVAGVAHEINNPVNFIYGNLKYTQEYIQDLKRLVELYQKSYPNPLPEVAETIEEIDLDYLLQDLPKMLTSMKVGADRIREIVLSLRNFSRLDEADYKEADLHQGIDSTLMILQNRLKSKDDRPEINIVKNYGTLPKVACFAGQLNQVYMNLLANAIDALEEAVSTGKIEAPEIQIETLLGENEAILRFSDNGVGIPEAIQSRLFDPFFTTKPVGQGTGMGLSISYQIVTEKHNGQLLCSSRPNQGTMFEIRIPLTQNIKD